MKIIQVTPGSGGHFYCQNCLRDSWQIQGLRRRGIDAILAPMYLPVSLDESEVPAQEQRLFFGGITVYLQNRWPCVRHLPRALLRWFDQPRLLAWLARRARTTRADALGPMTLSMLRGESGAFAGELDRLIAWISEERPDIVWLSNILLIGLARRIREVGIPVLCLLQDEESWINALPEPHRSQSWMEITCRAGEVEGLVAVSNFYAARLSRQLHLPREKIYVAYPGLPLEGYRPAAPTGTPVIGFMARMCQALGIDLMIDAYLRLWSDPRFKVRPRLHLCGGMTADDTPLLNHLFRQLKKAGAENDVIVVKNLDRSTRQEFLSHLSVLCLPAREEEAFSLSLLEALACHVPAVIPRHGSFPELIEMTGGGQFFTPNDPASLANTLADLLLNPSRCATLGAEGCAIVQRQFTIDQSCDELLSLSRFIIQYFSKEPPL